MLKPQDCAILIKLLAHPDVQYSQRQLSEQLNISLSEVNAGIKRLIESGLLRKEGTKQSNIVPIVAAAQEFLIHSLKYMLPVKLGEYTRGIPTSVAAPIFRSKISMGEEPVPVWPAATGKQRGVALLPIYSSIPKAIQENPDQNFYELLALIDAIRQGRARERNIAIKILKEKLHNE